LIASLRDHLNRKKQIPGFGLPPVAITGSTANEKGQSTCSMNMSDYNCGAVTLNNGQMGG